MDNNSGSLTDRIRGWFERSPKAQRIYERLSADLDAVVDWVESTTSGLRERVGPIIDPQREPAPGPASEPPLAQTEHGTLHPDESAPTPASTATADAGGAQQTSDPAIPESESSVPPGVKKDGQPIDPTS
ncbi:MAG TPA: hypothetical protein VFH48_20305 [Chloroflexota bacterium]|nr:hypothetical protein [Chloroflexota bacterium]